MGDHYLDVVDKNDEIIGRELKSQKDKKGFISRVAAVFLMDSNNNFILCKRHPKKKYAANLWDLAACGSLDAGETYEDAAKRELMEETGLDCKLKMLDKFYEEVSDDGIVSRFFCGVFVGMTSEVPKLNCELVEYKKMKLEDIEKEVACNPEKFCHGFINDFNKVKEQLKIK